MTHNETLVCSVLFLDLANYSKQPVADQLRQKQLFNAALAQALVEVGARDRIIVDTGDGAAITFPGDAESALLVALAMLEQTEKLPIRMGINLGPVHRIKDLNGNENVVGDGINVAQRIMSFAQPGQLLVSRSYHDMVKWVASEYENLFTRGDPRMDKHVREHEVYAVSGDVVAARRIAESRGRARTPVQESDAKKQPAARPSASEPASVFDAGTHLVVSGGSRESVERALQQLTEKGCAALTAPAQVGNKWIASCGHPRADDEVKVEQMGMQRMISGPSRAAVEDKVKEIVQYGGVLLTQIENIDGVWSAVCDMRA